MWVDSKGDKLGREESPSLVDRTKFIGIHALTSFGFHVSAAALEVVLTMNLFY